MKSYGEKRKALGIKTVRLVMLAGVCTLIAAAVSSSLDALFAGSVMLMVGCLAANL